MQQVVCARCGGLRPAPLTAAEIRALTRSPAPVAASSIPPAPSLEARVLALRQQSSTAPAVAVARGGRDQHIPPPAPSLVDRVMALRRACAGSR